MCRRHFLAYDDGHRLLTDLRSWRHHLLLPCDSDTSSDGGGSDGGGGSSDDEAGMEVGEAQQNERRQQQPEQQHEQRQGQGRQPDKQRQRQEERAGALLQAPPGWGAELLRRRVRVLWPGEGWFYGRVSDFSSASG
jgi:hypothetical protein